MTEHDHTPVSAWHAGEITLQRHVGVDEQMARVGHAIFRPVMQPQQQAFFAQLPFVVIGAVDPHGMPWATLRAGLPGFLGSPDPSLLSAELARDAADPAERGMEEGDQVGLLGIDLATRRRSRLNGTLQQRDEQGLSVAVGQSFGNCPQYIHRRGLTFVREPSVLSSVPALVATALDESARRMIAAADTFFVASYADRPDAGRQVDVSHRGGPAGFVRIAPDGGLVVPDYSGNQFFNTLGNFVVNPRAGLLFTDPASGDVLQISGKVDIILSGPEVDAVEGAERLWRVFPEKIVLRRDALPFRATTVLVQK
ncbi:pyridoxamine 5'-phosphate oxidase family protein [Massilia aurea]|uniref:pyridoxamine 5'-phosphate oxidase family protein n=1 Tax=Massilia aurea TaxID=373040 RepID=UPI0034627D4E